MKKSLTAVAVLSAIALPFAAQAVDEAELYGKFNVSAAYVDNDDDVDAADSIYLATSSSRIGIKGGKDLKAGLKASWQIENAIYFGQNAAGEGGRWGYRNTYVALSGGFGTLLAGRYDTPFKDARSKVDFFKEQPGDSRTLVKLKVKSKTNHTPTSRGWDERGNGFLYKSPSFSGASIYAQAEPGNGEAVPLASTALVYKMGKSLFASVAYEVHNTAPENETGLRAAAKYSMGAISVGGFVQQISDQAGVADETRTSFGAGAAYKMGGTTLKTQYLATGDTDLEADSDGSLIALGVDQKLGKMTKAYVTYTMTMNGKNAKFDATSAGYDTGGRIDGPAKGKDQMLIALGLIHAF